MNILLTGVTGQDGYYMLNYILKNIDYAFVDCGVRRVSTRSLEHVYDTICDERVSVVDLDISDPVSVSGVVRYGSYDYIFNFAANSFVGSSWNLAENHMTTNSLSVLYFLDSILGDSTGTKFFNAGSSEEFGDVIYSPQDENHPPRPQSPYGISKCTARQLINMYRKTYNLYAVMPWSFNHESERRGYEFVTRKITSGVARIALDKNAPPIGLGNLFAERDWGYAPDFMDAYWKMMNNEEPTDYVVSNGESHSVLDFLSSAFHSVGIIIEYDTKECNCFDVKNGRVVAESLDEFYRPLEVNKLRGNSEKIKKELGWSPSIGFDEMTAAMVRNDIEIWKEKLKKKQ